MMKEDQRPRALEPGAILGTRQKNKSFLLVLVALTVALLVASPGTMTRPAQAQTASADLSISGSASSDPAEAERELTYNLSVENFGPNAATNVVVEDTLPANVEFVSANPSQGTCTGTATVSCNLGDIPDFDAASVEIVVRPTATGTIENVATVSNDIQDPDTTNNESRISTEVKPPQAPLIAEAITRDQTFITGASFVERPPNGQPNIVSETPLAGFATHGPSYGILTTGDATIAGDPNNDAGSGASNGGGNVRGDTDFDVSILKVDLAVPQTASCLSIDFKYLSEEYPEFVDQEFNDAFIAELDNSTWATAGSTITSPNNFAFDQLGNPISINSTGSTSVSAEAAAGTTYDAATRLLTAKTPITPGAHSLYLSIFD